MPNDLVTDLQNLRNLTNTNRSNRAVGEPLVSNDQEVDWQVSC